MAVIELDLDAPPASAASRPPARRVRPLGLTLAALLTLVLTGAVPAAPLLWQPLGVIPLNDPDGSFLLDGDRVYTVATGPGDNRLVTAWDADGLTRTWSTGIPAEQPAPGVVASGVSLSVAGDAVQLTGSAYATTMIDAGTGRVRWTEPAPVLSTGAGIGITQETHFRAGTEYDQASGEPGDLYWSATGRPYTEPPRRTTVYGLDLTTGRRLWAADERGSALTVPVSGTAGAVLVISADRLALRDARTGTVRRQVDFPPATRPSWVDTAGDLLLVRRGTANGGALISAYRMATVEPLWQIDEPPDTGPGGYCVGLPCRPDRYGVAALDPRTGLPQWRTGVNLDLTAWDGGVVEARGLGGGPTRLLSRATGQLRAPLHEWNRVVVTAREPLLLTRVAAVGETSFGVLRPGSERVQPLGLGPGGASDCAISHRFVACRAAGGVAVWAYRA
ncbi:MAG TPA: PQQ-binding-like beta-propeller repeat protein [Actinoplanes sp.]|nr:PQQ-binding-like beta-propeller repeat protein [Actinoplanes sp.]